MDTFTLIAAERCRLADELGLLSDAEWTADSMCDGWTNHTVAAHLNLPWAGKKLDLMFDLVRARGNLAKTIDRASRRVAERLEPAACVAQLRAHATDRVVPPTLGPEAPLTDVVLHGADILRPLGRSVSVDSDAMAGILQFLTTATSKRAFRSVSLDGLELEAPDVGWRWVSGENAEADGGAGGVVSGPALAVAGILVGRRAYLPDLAGDGVARIAARLG